LPDATGAPVWIGFAIYIVNGSNPTTGILAQFISAFGTDMSLRYNPAYGIWVLVNGLGAELLVLSYAVTSGIWHWIDINYQFGSSGQVSVWVDNVNIGLNIVGNTAPIYNGSPYDGCLAVQLGDAEVGLYEIYIDDWYILEYDGSELNSYKLGDSKIETLVPTSDAGPNEGIPSTGNIHYLMVNEPQWSTSNLITLASQEENFGMSSISTSNIGFINCVQVVSIVAKQDTYLTYATSGLTGNGAIGDSNYLPLTITYSRIPNIFQLNPHTGDYWTLSEVNVVECGCITSLTS
jgi:hypothetical protein